MVLWEVCGGEGGWKERHRVWQVSKLPINTRVAGALVVASSYQSGLTSSHDTTLLKSWMRLARSLLATPLRTYRLWTRSYRSYTHATHVNTPILTLRLEPAELLGTLAKLRTFHSICEAPGEGVPYSHVLFQVFGGNHQIQLRVN